MGAVLDLFKGARKRRMGRSGSHVGRVLKHGAARVSLPIGLTLRPAYSSALR